MSEALMESIKKRIKRKEERLKEAHEKGDTKEAESLKNKITLLRLELQYINGGGRVLRSSDDPKEIEFLLSQKSSLLEAISNKIKTVSKDDLYSEKFGDIKRILETQSEYLRAKSIVIKENRSLRELKEYIRLAEDVGIELDASPLEHEAEITRFRPKKKEKLKRATAIDFKKIAMVAALILIILSVYLGTYWRKTPYDEEIIQSYIIARNHYIRANDYYVSGDYENSLKEYLTAAGYFNRAGQKADLASKEMRGNMGAYFSSKRDFFYQWEKISLKMKDSSRQFKSADSSLGAASAVEAVKMAEDAAAYNEQAEGYWGVL